MLFTLFSNPFSLIFIRTYLYIGGWYGRIYDENAISFTNKSYFFIIISEIPLDSRFPWYFLLYFKSISFILFLYTIYN